jgi:transposase-like protein
MERRRFGREQWVQWVEEQQVSGVSVVEFCRQREIPANSFYLWRRKLAAESLASSGSGPFVPLRLVPGSELGIDLPCGATIRIPADEATLRRVLSVLWSMGPAR